MGVDGHRNVRFKDSSLNLSHICHVLPLLALHRPLFEPIATVELPYPGPGLPVKIEFYYIILTRFDLIDFYQEIIRNPTSSVLIDVAVYIWRTIEVL